jgi:hypothetical protein
MPIDVFRVFSVVEDEFVPESVWPRRSDLRVGDVSNCLTNLARTPVEGPQFHLVITVGKTVQRRAARVPVPTFMTNGDLDRSQCEPVRMSEFCGSTSGIAERLWMFRGGIYLAERIPADAEVEEVVLRVKALHYKGDLALQRLREQVATAEAIENAMRSGRPRRTIPDDVKLLVWARDAGRCVRCGSKENIHYDHIIPHSRGGGDAPENLQILCRKCNLSKSDRIM